MPRGNGWTQLIRQFLPCPSLASLMGPNLTQTDWHRLKLSAGLAIARFNWATRSIALNMSLLIDGHTRSAVADRGRIDDFDAPRISSHNDIDDAVGGVGTPEVTGTLSAQQGSTTAKSSNFDGSSLYSDLFDRR